MEVAGRQLRVNQRPILLKGVNRHEHDERRGKAVTEEGMQRDVQLLKQFNFNSVRCAHYPNHPRWCAAPLTSGHNGGGGTCTLSFSVSCCGRELLCCAVDRVKLFFFLMPPCCTAAWATVHKQSSPYKCPASSDGASRRLQGRQPTKACRGESL